MHLERRAAGQDASGQPLVEYYTGVFKVPDGYISDSAASVTVRFTKKSCEIVKETILVPK